jgi:hypothetical protein
MVGPSKTDEQWKFRAWTYKELRKLVKLCQKKPQNWHWIAKKLNRDPVACHNTFYSLTLEQYIELNERRFILWHRKQR